MTCLAISPSCPTQQLGNAAAGAALDRWRLDRLTEARSILGDATDDPGSLVALAARVVIDHSSDAGDVARARGLLETCHARTKLAASDARVENGGAT